MRVRWTLRAANDRRAQRPRPNPVIPTKKATNPFSLYSQRRISSTKISAEGLFSLQICVIMKLTKSLPPMSESGEAASRSPLATCSGTRSVTEGAGVTLGLCQLHCDALSLTRLRRELPPGGSLRMRATLGVWALLYAFVIQRRNRL